MKKLVVTGDFADYRRGDQIDDPATIEAVIASNPGSVVVISVEDEPTRDSGKK